uniref:Protein transport protein Sec31A n=1 Tax=Sinocyclocheilus grahami TaxID=75366 RepID=A0A672MRZ3_SINGR
MKLKEIKRTALQAWSPAQQHPIYLAAGTSAQQLDATFSTNASLEIFELDLSDPTLAMKSCGSFSSPHRYHKLVWGAHGIEDQSLPSGVLIAGGENGNIILYDASKIIAGDSEVIISQSEKHTGPVRALDVNSFQTNLVASGGNESEIYIWDLNNLSSPMTPGPKTQPLEDISCVAWNRQVQHILASASPSGKASVWDLRKNDLIIKVSDHSNRMHCSGLAWNPEVATQLVLASEDDRMPVIQMWDLRFATSPLKVLESHTRGVLAIAWSEADPELLLSCGKDNRILCWNPNTAEVLYELPTSTQWCFDIQWCPRNPAVLSAAAFDGNISIYSIMGGSNDDLSSSFGNMDPFGTGKTLPPLQLPQTAPSQSTITPLKKPPKWIRRPVGASFAFGGKLVTLDNIKPAAQQPQQTAAHVVHISQVVTETDFLDRSNQLQATLTAGNFLEYCQNKTEAAQSEFEKTIWSFLKVNFEEDARGKYLELLGYKKEELALKVFLCVHRDARGGGTFNLPNIDGLITQALLTGDYEAAVNLCLHDNRMADGIILAIAGGPELLAKTQKKYFTKTQSKISKVRSCSTTVDMLLMSSVRGVITNERSVLLICLLGSRLDATEDTALQAQACLCYICAGTVEQLVAYWAKAQDSSSPLALQELVEKVVVLQRAVLRAQGGVSPDMGALLAVKMNQYASLLASQGSLQTAISYLPTNTQQVTIQFMPAAGTPGIYQPLQYSSSLASPLPPPPSAAAVYPPQFMHPASSQPAAPPVISGPPQGGQPFSPPPPLSSGMSFQHGGPGSPTAYLPPPVARAPGIQTEPALFPFSQRTGPQNGWNDPPALNRAPKKKKVPENFTPPAPITAPIMTPLGDPQVPAVQTMQTLQLQQQGPDQPVGPATFSPIQQQPLGPLGRNPSMPQGNMEGAPGAPIGDVIKPLQSIPSEKITKKPIPEEHMVLKTTFEGLIQKCLAAASDPQTKRKLDDAHKRLEYLYDKLREQTLSPAIVGGLHSMARSIECRCYTDGLNIHTHIVSSSNFSETSAFMPVLKVVLTQANKLAV